MTAATVSFQDVLASEGPLAVDVLLDCYDTLPPATLDFMLGEWDSGGVLATGHADGRRRAAVLLPASARLGITGPHVRRDIEA
jgi:hypothetical protein